MKQYHKNLLLIIAFLLIGSFAFKFSFSKTFEVKKELEELEIEIKNTVVQYDSHVLDTRIAYLDSIIDHNQILQTSLQNSLLKVLNENSPLYSYKLISFKEPHHYTPTNSGTTIRTLGFTLEGEYKNLEQILHKLEEDFSFGSLAHIRFIKEKNYRRNAVNLQAHILIQNVK